MSLWTWLFPAKVDPSASRIVDPSMELIDMRNPPRRVYRTDVFYLSGGVGSMIAVRSSELFDEKVIKDICSGSFDIPATEGFHRIIGVNLSVSIVVPNIREV